MLLELSSQNSDNINNILKTKLCIVFYYWTHCGFCQEIKPVWNKIAKKYANKSNIYIINVEVDNLELLRAKYKKNISGFPTIMKYSNGKRLEEFKGKRIFKDIDDFVKGNMSKTK